MCNKQRWCIAPVSDTLQNGSQPRRGNVLLKTSGSKMKNIVLMYSHSSYWNNLHTSPHTNTVKISQATVNKYCKSNNKSNTFTFFIMSCWIVASSPFRSKKNKSFHPLKKRMKLRRKKSLLTWLSSITWSSSRCVQWNTRKCEVVFFSFHWRIFIHCSQPPRRRRATLRPLCSLLPPAVSG